MELGVDLSRGRDYTGFNVIRTDNPTFTPWWWAAYLPVTDVPTVGNYNKGFGYIPRKIKINIF